MKYFYTLKIIFKIVEELLSFPIWHYKTRKCWVIDDNIRSYILETKSNVERTEIMKNVLQVLLNEYRNFKNISLTNLENSQIQLLCLSCRLENHIDEGMKGFRSLFNLVEKCDDLEIERVIDLSLEEIFDESISSSKLQHEELHNVYFMRGYYAFKKNEYDKSETFFERIYNCSHESYQYEKDIAVVSHLLGIIWTHKQLYLKAKDALERSIESLLKIGDQLYLAKVHNSYGNLLSLAPRCYNEAEKHYELALNICESEPGSHNLEIALTLNGLAELYLKEGKYDKALILCMRVLNIYENILLPENTSIVTTLNNLATVYCKMGGYGIALKICNRALGICENLFMHENSNVATTLNNLAMVYYKMGEYSRAFPLCKRTLDIRVNALGAEHLDVATSLNNLALLYDQMREREASTFCISELNIYENMY